MKEQEKVIVGKRRSRSRMAGILAAMILISGVTMTGCTELDPLETESDLQGAKGDKGDPGEQGIQGEKGEKGDVGAAGLTPYIKTATGGSAIPTRMSRPREPMATRATPVTREHPERRV